MKIEEVIIKEYKALKDIVFTPNGHNVLIIGENGIGKSTILQFIDIALGKQNNIPPEAHGDGVVVVNKDGSKYILKVKIKDGKSVVTVVTDAGLKDNRKGAIASLVGPIEFDIEAFVNLSKTAKGRKEQVEIVKGFFPIETQEEIRKYENSLIVEEQERTEIGRDRDKLHGSIESNPLKNENLSRFKSVDITAVSEELKKANEHNAEIAKIEERKKSRTEAIEKDKKSVEEKKAEIEKKKKEIEELEGKIKVSNELIEIEEAKNVKADEWLKVNAIKPIDEFETTIKNATDTNNKYNAAQALIKDMVKLESLKTEYGEQTVKIELTRQSIADTIRDIGLPVDGLTFDEEKLIYKGLPVHPESQSESEIMELGAKLKFCENPELGILLLERTESIGQKRWEDILKMCKDKGWQIIGEFVKRGQEELQIEIMAAE